MRRVCLWAVFLLFAVVAPLTPVGAVPLRSPDATSGQERSVDVLPVSAVRKGMRGVMKTVVEGTEVESFDVEILGVLPAAGPTGDLIIVQASDELVRRAGGIAAGMSGSPVYVDGRLIGAIGYGFNLTDHRVGLVTPIESMQAVLDMVEPGDVLSERPRVLDAVVTIDAGADTSWHPASAEDGGRPLKIVPLKTPVMVGGFSPRALERLRSTFEEYHLMPVQAGGAAPSGAVGRGVIEPGSAFGVQLVRGDFNLTSIGTVTHVEGSRFVGFGHPFTNRGEIGYFATEAYIHGVVSSIVTPFKLGSPLGPVGSVRQDRGAGVAGRLWDKVPELRFNITVRDADLARKHHYHAEMVRDEVLVGPLAAATALSAIDRTIDRIGRGTAHVTFRVEGDGMPEPLVRSNVFFSESDVAAVSLIELMEALRVVATNPFETVELTQVDVDVAIEQARRTARIVNARAKEQSVRPGDVVEIEVTLQPYRREAVRERLALTVPGDVSPGRVNVVVRAGGWGGEQPPDAEGELFAPGEGVSDLQRLLQTIASRERNNELIAEFYPRRDGQDESGSDDGWGEPFPNLVEDDAMPEPAPESRPGINDDDNGESSEDAPAMGWGWRQFPAPERVFTSVETPYVLTGTTSFDLRIVVSEEGTSDGADEGDVSDAGEKDVGEEGEGREEQADQGNGEASGESVDE